MKRILGGAFVSLIALSFAVVLALPALTLAESSQRSMFDEPAAVKTDEQSEAVVQSSADCALTIKYYEGVWYEDPDVEVDDSSRILLGEHVVTGLREGAVVNAWDYVVDIPGHMFFDGWPSTITISADPSQNVIELNYVKLWNSEFTVNYYVMLGADLTADNWTDALAPEGVEFVKLGSETFENQRYDSLVVGDAYEYKLDGMYVIDTYPAQIRLDLNPDNNVLNVLYTPDSVNLPDDMEIRDFSVLPDDVEVSDEPESGETAGDDAATDDDESGDSSDGKLPEDTTMSKDELIALLPDSVLVPTGEDSASDASSSEVADDFIGNDVGEGELEVTDEMLSDPQSKEEAAALKQAYLTGAHEASEAAAMGDILRVTPYICLAAVAIVVLVICIILSRRRKGRD